MARLTEHERTELVDRFIAQVGHLTSAQLKDLRREFNLRMAAGSNPLPDLQANYDVLVRLNKAIRETDAREAQQTRTSDEILTAEAEKLVKLSGVSTDVARRYLVRKQGESNPLDAPRQHWKPAPDPEPAEPARQKYNDERPDLRPYRIDQQ